MRRVLNALLDRAVRRIPVRTVVFDWPADVEAAAHLAAEQATRGRATDAGVIWDDEPIPYTLTDKATA